MILTRETNAVVVRFADPASALLAGKLPCSRWSGAHKAFRIPATPACVGNALDAFGWAAGWHHADEGVRALILAEVRRHAAVSYAATALEGDYEWHTTPWDHQVGATAFAIKMDVALLHCWMGAGKTKITFDAARARGHQRVLVCCPKSVIPVWATEAEKHAPGEWDVLCLEGQTIAKRALRLQNRLVSGKPVFAVMNYEATWRPEMMRVLTSLTWDLVVWDECQRIKTPGSKQSKFAASLRATHKLALTGTPMPHSPLDLYGQFRALDPGIFGTSFGRFRDQYAVLGPVPGQPRAVRVLGFKNETQLKAQMDRLTYCVPKDALDLPDLQVNERYCELSKAERKVYNGLEREFIAEVKEGIVTASNALAKLLRLQQVAAGFAKCEDGIERPTYDGKWSAKEGLLRELVEDIGKDERIIVFCKFKHDLRTVRRVAEELGRGPCGEISGSHHDYQDWKAGAFTTLAVQIQAGGLGIDLTESCYVLYYTIGFSLGDYIQSIARAHRPGQARGVQVYRLVARDTVDVKLVRALDNRDAVIRAILDDVKG